MLREISFGLLCMAACYGSNSYSMDNNIMQYQGVTVEYILEPNKPLPFVNYMFWPVEANCIILTEDESDTLYILGRAKKGKINDITVVAGQSLQITVHPNENLKINADSGAKVEITNLGEHTVKASCSA